MFARKKTIAYSKPTTTTTTRKTSTTPILEEFFTTTDPMMMGPTGPEEFPSEGPSEGPSGLTLEPASLTYALPPLPVTKKNFVEVIDFVDIEVTRGKKNGTNFDPVNAEASVIVPTPQSITSYEFHAISMNNIYGLGLTDDFTSLNVFQDFFIQVTFPHHCKRTEIVTLNIGILSYLQSNQPVTLSVTRNDADFTVMRPSDDGWTIANDRYHQNLESIPNKASKFNIAIKPHKIGSIKIKIEAIGTIASDALEKPLKVIPEGVPKSITKSVLILKNETSSTFTSSLNCTLPPTAVNDTTSASASIAGDLMGPMIKGLENLIQMPYGCGEQNLLTMAASVIALRYLEATNQLTSTLRVKGTKYTEDGYQRQLSYIRGKHSFSAFGRSDPNESTWLTAFSVQVFSLAQRFITVDSQVIQNAFNSLVIKQDRVTGMFREDGNVIHKDMQGGSSNGVPLTAFVSIVLSENIAQFSSFVTNRNKALDYINLNANRSDPYTLCICAYALKLGNHVGFNDFYNEMLAQGIETADMLSWSKPLPVSSYSGWYDQPRSVDIEMTAYALKVLTKVDIAKALKAAKNIVSKQNSLGGYSSTQDTVQALDALSLFGMEFNAVAGSINIRLTPNIGSVINAQVNKNNMLTLQDFTLNPLARKLNIFSGPNNIGKAIVSFTCNFYENSDETAPRFNIRTELIRSCKQLLRHQVCVSYISQDDDVESNMALVKIKFPSGYVYDEGQELPRIIRRLDKEDDGTTINAYFDSFTSNETCFIIQSVQQCEVTDLIDSTMEIVDYYNPEKKSQILYNIPSNLIGCGELPPEDGTTTESWNEWYYVKGPSEEPDYFMN